MLHPNEIRTLIKQALMPLGYTRFPLYTANSEELLMVVEAHESHNGMYLKQIGGGTARGLCQVEIGTMEDNYTNYLNYHTRKILREQIEKITNVIGPNEDALTNNHLYNITHALLLAA